MTTQCTVKPPEVLVGPNSADSFTAACISKDGKILAAIRGHTLLSWRLMTDQQDARPTSEPAVLLDAGTKYTSLAIARNSREVLAAGDNGKVYVVNRINAKISSVLYHASKDNKSDVNQDESCHDTVIHNLSVSPEGNLIATCGADGRTLLWDGTDKALIAILQDSPGKSVPSKTPRTETPSDSLIHTWRTESHDVLARSSSRECGTILACAFSVDGRWLAAAGELGIVQLWDVECLEDTRSYDGTKPKRPFHLNASTRRLLGHEAPITAVAFSTVVAHLASLDLQGVCFLWDSLRGMSLARTAAHDAVGSCVAIVRRGRGPEEVLITSGYNGTIALWEIPANTQADYSNVSERMTSAAISEIESQHLLETTQLPSLRCLASYRGHSSGQTPFAHRFAMIQLHPEQIAVARGSHSSVRTTLPSRLPIQLLTCGLDQRLLLWTLPAPVLLQEPHRVFCLPYHTFVEGEQAIRPIILNAVWLSCGRRIATTSVRDPSVRIWQAQGLRAGQLLCTLRGLARALTALGTHGEWAVAGDEGGGVAAWYIGQRADTILNKENSTHEQHGITSGVDCKTSTSDRCEDDSTAKAYLHNSDKAQDVIDADYRWSELHIGPIRSITFAMQSPRDGTRASCNRPSNQCTIERLASPCEDHIDPSPSQFADRASAGKAQDGLQTKPMPWLVTCDSVGKTCILCLIDGQLLHTIQTGCAIVGPVHILSQPVNLPRATTPTGHHDVGEHSGRLPASSGQAKGCIQGQEAWLMTYTRTAVLLYSVASGHILAQVAGSHSQQDIVLSASYCLIGSQQLRVAVVYMLGGLQAWIIDLQGLQQGPVIRGMTQTTTLQNIEPYGSGREPSQLLLHGTEGQFLIGWSSNTVMLWRLQHRRGYGFVQTQLESMQEMQYVQEQVCSFSSKAGNSFCGPVNACLKIGTSDANAELLIISKEGWCVRLQLPSSWQ